MWHAAPMTGVPGVPPTVRTWPAAHHAASMELDFDDGAPELAPHVGGYRDAPHVDAPSLELDVCPVCVDLSCACSAPEPEWMTSPWGALLELLSLR